jgi:hypothetical protein|tara:strand:+ start:8 stop:316 length:309 start_codon:yes stop_codon:yes gene_type:complete
MNDEVCKPRWYVRYGIECYTVIKVLTHNLFPMEVIHMSNHVKYCFRWLEKNKDAKIQKQDLDKANETWTQFYAEAKNRFKIDKVTIEEIMIDKQLDELHDED